MCDSSLCRDPAFCAIANLQGEFRTFEFGPDFEFEFEFELRIGVFSMQW